MRTMPEISWDTFERYRQNGLDARRAGQWDSARVYLLEAARAMTFLAKDATGEELQQGRRDMAAKLLELARGLGKGKEGNRGQPQVRRGGGGATKEKTAEGGGGECGRRGRRSRISRSCLTRRAAKSGR